MSDIVERARDSVGKVDTALKEMADEIERLRDAVLGAWKQLALGSDSERHPLGPRCTCKFHPDRDEIVEPDPACGVHGSVIQRSEESPK